jgi:hypothetical protein
MSPLFFDMEIARVPSRPIAKIGKLALAAVCSGLASAVVPDIRSNQTASLSISSSANAPGRRR